MEPLNLNAKTPLQRRKAIFSLYFFFQFHFFLTLFELHGASRFEFQDSPPVSQGTYFFYTFLFIFLFSYVLFSFLITRSLSIWIPRSPRQHREVFCFSFLFSLFYFSFFFFFFYHSMIISRLPASVARNLFPCHFILWDFKFFYLLYSILITSRLVSVNVANLKIEWFESPIKHVHHTSTCL